MDDKIVRFNLEGKRYELDVEDLTFDEWDELERVLDCPFEDASRIKSTRALIYIAIRRDNPAVTYEEIGQVKPAKSVTEDTAAETVEEVPDSRPLAPGEVPVSVSGSNGSVDVTVPPPVSAVGTTPGSSGGL